MPRHCALRKDASLKEKSVKLAGSEELLKREFSKMVGWAQRNVDKATTVGSREENRLHNRYKDIGEKPRSHRTT